MRGGCAVFPREHGQVVEQFVPLVHRTRFYKHLRVKLDGWLEAKQKYSREDPQFQDCRPSPRNTLEIRDRP